MPYIAKGNFSEQIDVFGNGQCVALVRELTGAPASSTWREGESIVDLLERNAYVAPGTAIATFFDGRYPNRAHGNHAAIFVGWAGDGIEVAASNRRYFCVPSIIRWSNEGGHRARRGSSVDISGRVTRVESLP